MHKLEESKIRFVNYQILDFEMHQEDVRKIEDHLNVAVFVETYRNNFSELDTHYIDTCELSVGFSGKNSAKVGKVFGRLKIIGVYKADKSDVEKVSFATVVSKSALTQLIGIVRAFLVNITAQSGTGVLMIPLLDVTKDSDVLANSLFISYEDMFDSFDGIEFYKPYYENFKMKALFGNILNNRRYLIEKVYKGEAPLSALENFLDQDKMELLVQKENHQFIGVMVSYIMTKLGFKQVKQEPVQDSMAGKGIIFE